MFGISMKTFNLMRKCCSQRNCCLIQEMQLLFIFKSFLFEHNIPLSNIIAYAFDGAPSVIGRYRGFSTPLKYEISYQILTVHCLAYQHLVAKNMNSRSNDVFQLDIKTEQIEVQFLIWLNFLSSLSEKWWGLYQTLIPHRIVVAVERKLYFMLCWTVLHNLILFLTILHSPLCWWLQGTISFFFVIYAQN